MNFRDHYPANDDSRPMMRGACDEIWGSGETQGGRMPSTQARIQTARLCLRPFDLADAVQVRALAGDIDVARYMTLLPHPYPDGYAETWIKTHAADFRQERRVTYAITLREPDTLIGTITLGLFRLADRGELGFWLGKQYWGSGYATEAGMALLTYGFKALDLHRIQARHATQNPASGRVLRKLGMKHEGTLRHDLKLSDRYEDSELYAVLVGESG